MNGERLPAPATTASRWCVFDDTRTNVAADRRLRGCSSFNPSPTKLDVVEASHHSLTPKSRPRQEIVGPSAISALHQCKLRLCLFSWRVYGCWRRLNPSQAPT